MSSQVLSRAEIPVRGVDCAACAEKVERGLASLGGVEKVEVEIRRGLVRVAYCPDRLAPEALEARVRELGFAVATPRVRTRIEVPGLCCDGEAGPIRALLEKTHGVEAFDVSVVGKQVWVDHLPGRVSGRDLALAIRGLGLEARVAGEAAVESPWERRLPVISLAAGAALLAASFAGGWLALAPRALATLLAAAAILLAGWPFFRRALSALAHRRVDMNVLMTISVAGAALLGDWREAATVAVLFNLAELIEQATLERARRAIAGLMDLVPPRASVKRGWGGGAWTEVPVEEVRPGERVQVKPGEQVPLDGRVVAGESHVDQAPITGESAPVAKRAGSAVYAGTLNRDGWLELEVTRPFEDTTLARIIQRVEEARAQKAPSERFVDRFARVYTPAVVLLAALVAVLPPLFFGAAWSAWIYRALVLLVISCPCALVISTPVSIISALTSAARAGVLIKGGAHLEALGRVRAVALDKTGTLTLGRVQVTRVCPARGVAPEEVLRLAAALEARSSHPVGQAILERAAGQRLPALESFQSLPGRGLEGRVEGRLVLVGSRRLIEERTGRDLAADPACPHDGEAGTAVCVAAGGAFLGTIHTGDSPRPGAARALHWLAESGVERLVLLTGDNEPTARAVAGALGLREWKSDLLPDDKVAAVRELAARHGSVAMVGDGVNDAPALAAATVGIAMGAAGSDTALETADVALMADDLEKVSFAIRLGRRARRVIGQNIVLSLSIKLVFLGLAAAGLATLWSAIAADLGASLLVIFNGLRLLGGAPAPCGHAVAEPAGFA